MGFGPTWEELYGWPGRGRRFCSSRPARGRRATHTGEVASQWRNMPAAHWARPLLGGRPGFGLIEFCRWPGFSSDMEKTSREDDVQKNTWPRHCRHRQALIAPGPRVPSPSPLPPCHDDGRRAGPTCLAFRSFPSPLAKPVPRITPPRWHADSACMALQRTRSVQRTVTSRRG